MASLKPRPFHIGTQVRRKDTDEYGTVLFCQKFGDPWWVYYDVDDDYLADATCGHLVHAEDGAPLGQWVPLNPLWYQRGITIYPSADKSDLMDGLTDKANAIIRGEVEQ